MDWEQMRRAPIEDRRNDPPIMRADVPQLGRQLLGYQMQGGLGATIPPVTRLANDLGAFDLDRALVLNAYRRGVGQ
jgi:hypothetical protein